jgi:hypothetical protein
VGQEAVGFTNGSIWSIEDEFVSAGNQADAVLLFYLRKMLIVLSK